MSGLAERLARCLPGASFELETLVRLVGIEETEAIPTAAVTCRGRARLLINPRFVAEHCRRDEHLFLLVMHELWHVLLGHTTLYARPTPDHNIAFDAIINAGLTRQHPAPAYRGFFDVLNPPDVFPALLLRPPLGWPKHTGLRRPRPIRHRPPPPPALPAARPRTARAHVRRTARPHPAGPRHRSRRGRDGPEGAGSPRRPRRRRRVPAGRSAVRGRGAADRRLLAATADPAGWARCRRRGA